MKRINLKIILVLSMIFNLGCSKTNLINYFEHCNIQVDKLRKVKTNFNRQDSTITLVELRYRLIYKDYVIDSCRQRISVSYTINREDVISYLDTFQRHNKSRDQFYKYINNYGNKKNFIIYDTLGTMPNGFTRDPDSEYDYVAAFFMAIIKENLEIGNCEIKYFDGNKINEYYLFDGIGFTSRSEYCVTNKFEIIYEQFREVWQPLMPNPKN